MDSQEKPMSTMFNGINYGRQLSFFNPAQDGNIPITMIGAGAIGSFTCLCLAKVGFHNITVYDFDKVSEENIPNQFYPISAIDQPKVTALQKYIKEFTGVEINVDEARFKDQAVEPGLLICGVDSMQARQVVFERFTDLLFENKSNKTGLVGMIDARMGGLVYRIYTLKPTTNFLSEYEDTLYSDAEAAPERCTEKAVIFNVAEIASKITALAVGLIHGRALPFELIGDIFNFEIFRKYKTEVECREGTVI